MNFPLDNLACFKPSRFNRLQLHFFHWALMIYIVWGNFTRTMTNKIELNLSFLTILTLNTQIYLFKKLWNLYTPIKENEKETRASLPEYNHY